MDGSGQDIHGEITARLKLASEIVEAAGLPVELRPAAFEQVFSMLAGTAGHPARDRAAEGHAAPRAGLQEQDRLGRLASRLGVERERAEYIFDASEADLVLVLARSRLPGEKRRATRALAILTAAGRQAGYSEEWTPVSAIREQCRVFGVLDTANFSSALAATGDALLFRGQGAARAAKVTRAGFEEAARLVAELTR
jgi:hypothetical protein